METTATYTRLASDLDPQVRQADAAGAESLEAILAAAEADAARQRAAEEEERRLQREIEQQTLLTHLGARQVAFARLLREGLGDALYGALAREADLRFEGFDERGYVGNRHYALPRARFTLRAGIDAQGDAAGAAHDYTLLPLNGGQSADALLIALIREDDGVVLIEACRLDPEMREALGPVLAAQRARLRYDAQTDAQAGQSAEERARQARAAWGRALADALHARYALARAALAAQREQQRLFQAANQAGARLVAGGEEPGAARLVELAVTTRAKREYASHDAPYHTNAVGVEARLEAVVTSDGKVILTATQHARTPDKKGRSATTQRIPLNVDDMQRLMAVWMEWREERLAGFLDATREAAAEAQREIGLATLLARRASAGTAGTAGEAGEAGEAADQADTLEEQLEGLETIDDPTADVARQSCVALAWRAIESARQIVDAYPGDIERQERAAWEMLSPASDAASAAASAAASDA